MPIAQPQRQKSTPHFLDAGVDVASGRGQISYGGQPVMTGVSSA